MKRKICKHCGEINSGSARYCSNCHRSLNDAEIKTDDYEPMIIGKHHSDTIEHYMNTSKAVSIGEWIIILIILGIPFINILALFYMAFGYDNENVRTFGKSLLILSAIGTVIFFLIRSCSGI